MKTWRWKANDDILYSLGIKGHKFNNDFFSLSPDGYAIVKAGYASDGMTPQALIAGIGYIGPPEGKILKDEMLPVTFRSFFIHDALNQFRDEIGITRAQTHPEFCKEVMKTEFPLRRLYCWGVNLYGVFRR